MSGNVRPKSLDYMVIIVSLAILVSVSYTIYADHSGASQVEIIASGVTYYYPLTTDRIVEIKGPLGITRVAVADGTVKIIDSPCPDKLCIQAGEITTAGKWLACLPNRVFVKILGKEAESVDAHSY